MKTKSSESNEPAHIARVLSGAASTDHSRRDTAVVSINCVALLLIDCRNNNAAQNFVGFGGFQRRSPSGNKDLRLVVKNVSLFRKWDYGNSFAIQGNGSRELEKGIVKVEVVSAEALMVEHFSDFEHFSSFLKRL